MDLAPEHRAHVEVHVVPHVITLSGKTYLSGVDLTSSELYRLLGKTEDMPSTAQPAASEFAEVYRRLAKEDPDILSIHMSSGLSGVVNAARVGAQIAPEANVTIVDTKTLSVALGWHVAAAVDALKAGWPKERIIELLKRIGDATESIYTLQDLRYLIHGGRISHMKGLLASALKIKPLIGVEKVGGTYVQLGMARTFERAVKGLVKIMMKKHEPGSTLRVQVGHAWNPNGLALLREEIEKHFECNWLPEVTLSAVLGAHTGPTMVGVAYAAQAEYPALP
jgi:DegV family protein with EDD domain